MALPTVEIETESAGRHGDVDLEKLHRLVSQLSAENSYLIVHRDDKPEEFAQAAIERRPDAKLVAGAFIVEFKDESGAQHQLKTRDLEQVGDVLAGWAFDLAGWNEGLEWDLLTFNNVINLAGNCTVAQVDGVWVASFPPMDISATGSSEDEAMAELRTVLAETTNRDPEKRAFWAKWCSENVIELPPEEWERTRPKLSPEQQERVKKSFSDAMRTREPRRSRRGRAPR